jgi:peptide/nickel transport system permease protein
LGTACRTAPSTAVPSTASAWTAGTWPAPAAIPGSSSAIVLPNCLAPIIVTTTLGIATSIIVEATLSFLGLGTQPPTPSWGWDLKANLAFIQDNLWLSLFPGLAIFFTVLGFNLFGDGLRDALDPRLK